MPLREGVSPYAMLFVRYQLLCKRRAYANTRVLTQRTSLSLRALRRRVAHCAEVAQRKTHLRH